MATQKVTSEQVIAFWDYMQNKYGFRVVQKANAEEMQAISWALDMIGIMDHERFMKQYTTTLGRVVYVPFVIGKGNNGQLLAQMKTCVHETQHVLQYMRNPAKYTVNYLRSDAALTHYEVDAYRTTMEMHYYLYGTVLSPSRLANLLKGYAVGTGDIHVARKHLSVSAKVVKHGVIMSGVSKDAIRWMRRSKIRGHRVVFAA